MKITGRGLTSPGNIINEDIYSIVHNAAWVIDGSSGLRNTNITGYKSDTQWFVSRWNEYLTKNINTDKSLSEIILGGIDAAKEEYKNFTVLHHPIKLDMPSASIAIIRVRGQAMEYFVLGDCSILYKLDDEKVCEITDNSVSKLDKRIITKARELSKINNIPILDAKELCYEDIMKNRLLKNTKKGYWILEFDKKAVTHAIAGTINTKAKLNICMMSDGFSQYYDTLGIVKNRNEFFGLLEKTSLEDLLRKLRETQQEDSLCNKYPRLKTGDDATIVYIQISNTNRDNDIT